MLIKRSPSPFLYDGDAISSETEQEDEALARCLQKQFDTDCQLQLQQEQKDALLAQELSQSVDEEEDLVFLSSRPAPAAPAAPERSSQKSVDLSDKWQRLEILRAKFDAVQDRKWKYIRPSESKSNVICLDSSSSSESTPASSRSFSNVNMSHSASASSLTESNQASINAALGQHGAARGRENQDPGETSEIEITYVKPPVPSSNSTFKPFTPYQPPQWSPFLPQQLPQIIPTFKGQLKHETPPTYTQNLAQMIADRNALYKTEEILGKSNQQPTNPYSWSKMHEAGPSKASFHPASLLPQVDPDELGYERPLNDMEQKEALKQLLSNAVGAHDITPKDKRMETPADLRIQLLEHQKLGLEWMLKMERGSNRGGILADDMGLGKTIQSISTILSNPSEDRRCKATLVIAPTSLVLQVCQHILIHSGNKKSRIV